MVRAWVRINGCREEPAIQERPDRAQDGTRVALRTYSGGRGGSEVVLVTVHGGGHTWPGRPARSRALGRATGNVSANDLVWEFFRRHPMAESSGLDGVVVGSGGGSRSARRFLPVCPAIGDEMKSHTGYLTFTMPDRGGLVDITPRVEPVVRRGGMAEGA